MNTDEAPLNYSSPMKSNRDLVVAEGNNLSSVRGREQSANKVYGAIQKDVIYQSYKEEIENEKKEIARKLVQLDMEKTPSIKDLSKSTDDVFGEVGSGVVDTADFEDKPKKSGAALEKFRNAAKKVTAAKAVITSLEFGLVKAGVVTPSKGDENVKITIKRSNSDKKTITPLQTKQKFRIENNQKMIKKADELRRTTYRSMDCTSILGVEKYMLLHEKRFSPKCMIDAMVISKQMPRYIHTREILFESKPKIRKGDPGYEEYVMEKKKRKYFNEKKKSASSYNIVSKKVNDHDVLSDASCY